VALVGSAVIPLALKPGDDAAREMQRRDKPVFEGKATMGAGQKTTIRKDRVRKG